LSTLDTIARFPDRIVVHTPTGERRATIEGQPDDLDVLWPHLTPGHRVVDADSAVTVEARQG